MGWQQQRSVPLCPSPLSVVQRPRRDGAHLLFKQRAQFERSVRMVFGMRSDQAVACRAAILALFIACCAGGNQRSLSLFDPPEFHLPPHPPGAALMSDKFVELPLSAYGDYPSPLTPGSVLMLNTHFQETALPAFIEWPQSQDVFFQSQSFTWEVWVYPFPNQAIGSSILGNLLVGPPLQPCSVSLRY